MKRALRAPFKTGARRPALQCARTALNLHWIPAFAGMADIFHASEKFFRAALDFRSFYTACFAGMARRRCVLGCVLIRVSIGRYKCM